MPAIIYRNAAGKRLPSVTTVLKNLGWSTEGLKWWAYHQGLDGKEMYETQQDAQDVGTISHAMVEGQIHGRAWQENGEDPELILRAHRAFEQYQQWAESTRIHIIATEVKLISEEHQFGGTPDAIALVNGALSIPDWKTGGSLFADHVIQVAAYLHAAEEVTGLAFEGGAHLCRFDKEAGGFLHRWIPRAALGPAWRVFLRLRDIHEQKKALEALAK